jgi:hypothetical protein
MLLNANSDSIIFSEKRESTGAMQVCLDEKMAWLAVRSNHFHGAGGGDQVLYSRSFYIVLSWSMHRIEHKDVTVMVPH